ncbi:CehA/McbA family metallohydrolase [Trujillonella endophytica]|uniref:CehA/McbA family metallohydrolase n=1 Tax=Trujillonella endophytica TaxID=673521 RepID=A0A1H8WD53_9ACTN|nr:CehA/McbA family metallohydrolase [Trujillella endophytica]SEP25551.1 hypothetical protein SAMN05660991_04297 [Trujillella endophytica]
MCCAHDEVLDLPPAVIEMLAHYRRLRADQGWGWGEEEPPDLFRWARFGLLGPSITEYASTGDWAAAVRSAVAGRELPAGLAVVTVAADGTATARTGPSRPGIAGRPVPVDVLVLSAADRDLEVTVDGVGVPVPAGGVGLRTVDVDPAAPGVAVATGGSELGLLPVHLATPGSLRLVAPECARWSVTDPTGGPWGPAGRPAKWDALDRPYWHGADETIEVPAGPVHVVVCRGLEYERVTVDVVVAPGGHEEVRWSPVRRFDPGADGWRSGDLHVHLNYSGDHVLDPADAARMQAGEGLDLVQLAAGNLGGALVYDRELLEGTAGEPLWSGDHVGVAGLEFRNDLLGHLHALGHRSVPDVLHTGHEGTGQPWDWPPNAAACADLRERGGLPTYAHPSFSPLDDVAALYGPYRSVEARELVADAALGLVGALEVVSCADDRGAVVLWHHLLNCGLRPAATAGTDVFLSFAHGPGVASNPPGWGRVYARLDGAPLTVASFRDAVAAGRTVVTNGPWVTLTVDGAGPGAVLDRRPGDVLRVAATVAGSGVDRFVLHGPDGELAATDGTRLAVEVPVSAATWLTAAAYGGDDPHTLGAPVFASTSPVHVEVAGRRVARAASARWCLAALDGLAALAEAEGRFDPARREAQLGDLLDVVERARAFYRGVLADAPA